MVGTGIPLAIALFIFSALSSAGIASMPGILVAVLALTIFVLDILFVFIYGNKTDRACFFGGFSFAFGIVAGDIGMLNVVLGRIFALLGVSVPGSTWRECL